MSGNESSDSLETFGENPVDYNPFFVTDKVFETREEAVKWAKGVALEIGFALVIANNGWKNHSLKDLRACYLRCNRYGRPEPIDDPEKRKKSTKCSCGFRIRLVENRILRNGNTAVVWNVVTAENGGRHNHNLIVYKDGDRHYAKLNDEEKSYIKQQAAAGVLPRDIKRGLHQKTPEKPQPSSTQIYNETRKCKRESRGEMNPAQHMMSLAVVSKYVMWTEKEPETKEITHLFMGHPECVMMFRSYYHVVIIDSTYNTNQYKRPIIEMVGVTPTGSSFLIACALLPVESEDSYKWLLNKLVALLESVGVLPSVFITDRELGLIRALKSLFPNIPHLLCRWHVMKAVNAKALTLYAKESMRIYALSDKDRGWHGVINAISEEELERVWGNFTKKWPAFGDYITSTWGDHASKFVLCYTNEVFHLGNTATSRVESQHSLLKSWLKSSHLNLDTMWLRVHDMLEAQLSKIRKELEASRSKPRLTAPLFALLKGKVSTMAIELMESELKRGLGLGIGLAAQCGHVMRVTHGLPCACNLVGLHSRNRRVHLEDIHNFWKKLTYETDTQMPSNDNELLEELIADIREADPVYKRAVIDLLRDFRHPEDAHLLPPRMNENPKGRPRGSTSRNKSAHEHVHRKFGSGSNRGSATPVTRVGDFQSGPNGAPLERNYTIGSIVSWEKRWGIPEVMWPYFDGWVDVGDDGHCGFRVISHAHRGEEKDYILMREWCAREMRSDRLYARLFGDTPWKDGAKSGYEINLARVEFMSAIPCGAEHWLGEDMLIVFATLFNWTICVLGHNRTATGEKRWEVTCNTILPLKTNVDGRLPYGIMWILNYHSHWMRLHSSEALSTLPMPPPNVAWMTFRDDSVAHLETLYGSNFELWRVRMGTPERTRRRSKSKGNSPPATVISCDSS